MIGKAHLERPIPELSSHLAHSFSVAEKKKTQPAPGLGTHGLSGGAGKGRTCYGSSQDRQRNAATMVLFQPW
jgi:hypothetical protein